MASETENLKGELRGLVRHFFSRGWSEATRRELADTIDRAYIGKIIDREEYQSMMGAIR